MSPRPFYRCLAPLLVLLLLCLHAVEGKGKTWCVAKENVSEDALRKGIDYACGEGQADCSAIQPGGSCYEPNTVHAHASYAFDSYYQGPVEPTKLGWHGITCDFNGIATLTSTNPSHGNCIYP